jgi:hypothetical protein
VDSEQQGERAWLDYLAENELLRTFTKPISATDPKWTTPLFSQAHLLENAFDQAVASLPLEWKNIRQTCRDLVT